MSLMTSASVPARASSLACPPIASRSAPGRRTVTATLSLPKGRTQVTLSPVSYQHDDTARLFPRDRDRRGHGCAPGHTAEETLLACESLRHRDRFVCRHDPMLVRDTLVPDRRPQRRRHVLPALYPVERVIRLHRDDPHP